MPFVRLLIHVLLIIGLGGPVAFSSVRAQDVKFIRIGTGPIGGTYFPVGGLIANVISGPPGSTPCGLGGGCGVPGLIAAAVSTQGSVNNIQDMTAEKLDLALCQADIAYDAYTGVAPYLANPFGALRIIANLFPEAVHVVVRADGEISSIGDLAGRRVSLGEANSGTLATARVVLSGHGLAVKDLKPVYERLARSAEMLATGEIDAFFMVGGQPVAAIVHVAERVPVAVLAIKGREAERIIKMQRFLLPTIIPANAYRGVPATETIGVAAQLVVSANMDEELVHEITRALWDPRNRRVFESGGPNSRLIQLQSALETLPVPLHEGARRFYLEKGITKAAHL